MKDFEDGIDQLDLTGFAYADFNALLTDTSNSGSGLRINFGDGNVFFIENFSLADFDASDVLL